LRKYRKGLRGWGSSEPSLGILLEYPSQEEKPEEVLRERTVGLAPPASRQDSDVRVGFIGSGDCDRCSDSRLRSDGGCTRCGRVERRRLGSARRSQVWLRAGTHRCRRRGWGLGHHFAGVATRHGSHARYVCDALAAGKHVFVEKPLALTRTELKDIQAAYAGAGDARPPVLAVGFKRRFSSLVQKVKELLAEVHEPKSLVMAVNAGMIPADHWTQDPAGGGGRIIGEACHFIDLLRYLAGHPIAGVQVTAMGVAPGVAPGVAAWDGKVSFTLSFPGRELRDGSLACQRA
jgi:hypothetical protein